MDALKLLKAEIQNKRKLLDDLGVVDKDKKYFKQADLDTKLEEEGRKRNRTSSIGDDNKDGDDSSQDAAASSHADHDGKHAAEKHLQMPAKEVVRRLRELGQPIRLFGESDDDALIRLKEVEGRFSESVKGMRNDLQEALQKVDDEYLKELMESNPDSSSASGLPGTSSSSSAASTQQFDCKVIKRDETTLEDLQREATGKFGKGNDEYDTEFMIRFFKHIIGLWAEELNARPLEVKQSQQGRLDTAIHSQTVEYMKPFLKRLNKKSRYSKRDVLGLDLVECVVEMVKHLLQKNYLKAHESYLLCAVGNAAWPIGATMVGIHARPGREKLSSRNIAHVMNNETHRKFITGVKRLMARCQRLYPTDPSKSVNFDSHDQR